MPVGKPVAYQDTGSIGEQLLGKGDTKRSTKTFIEDGPLAVFLGILRNNAKSIVNTGRRLHAEDTGKHFDDVTVEEMIETYPEIEELIELHQWIIEHKGSQEGFLVDRYVKRASQQELDERKESRESSGDSNGGNKRWN